MWSDERRSIWLDWRSETMQHDQQLQALREAHKASIAVQAKVRAAQGPQRAASSTDKDEDHGRQSERLSVFQPKVSGKIC